MHQVEVVTERYNAANDELGKKRAAAARADRTAKALDAQLDAASGKVRQIASATYRAMPFSDFTSMMTSISPQNRTSWTSSARWTWSPGGGVRR